MGPVAMPAHDAITELLRDHRGGDPTAAERLFPLVYGELRSLASARFASERAGHTLQPTAVVHEVYLKLVDQAGASYADRRHFLAVAATAMRRVLIDHARGRRAEKRTPGGVRLELDEALERSGVSELELLALEEALGELEASEPRMARVVELRYFGGLAFEEIADLIGVSAVTAKRDWAAARGWLSQRLGPGDG